MVGLHVVDDDVVDRTVADDAAHVVYELREEVYFYCVYERYLLVVDDIGVVAYAERQGPETLKECFVAIVDAYWMNVGHVMIWCYGEMVLWCGGEMVRYALMSTSQHNNIISYN